MSFFDKVILAPPDPILGMTENYLADLRENKVNLGVGYYKDHLLRTPILESVKQAETILLESEPNKEYLPIAGHQALIENVGEMLFGSDFWGKEHPRIAGFQTVGGTGALKIGGTFLKEELDTIVLVPDLTWPNHKGVFSGCGLKMHFYPYYDQSNHRVAFDAVCEFLEKQKRGSTVLLHASCHNPTGCDPTLEEWKILCSICAKKELIPFFDCAYQGFGQSLDEDAQCIRIFAESGLEMLIAFSAAKNFSLYGERVGVLFIVTKDRMINKHVTSRVKQMIRTNYSNPPKHGAAIVAHILQDENLKKLWVSELNSMRSRINLMRTELGDRLLHHGKKFLQIKNGRGMFCVMGLSEKQVDCLITRYGIHMSRDGRINVCGLNEKNIEYVADAILKVS